MSEMQLILGHNQFIGISHISEERSREKERKFSRVENIYSVVETASDLGFKSMMIETHPRMLDFIKLYRERNTFDMEFYLQIPYVHGYIQKMNENGINSMVSEIIGKNGLKEISNLALKGAVNLIKQDYISLALSSLNLEIAEFDEINIKALLLHNVTTDLLLALKIPDAFAKYLGYVKDELHIEPGFITLNFPLLLETLKELDLGSPLIMTPINPQGYDMNPSASLVEAKIRSSKNDIIAMNILGGGAFPIEKSYAYLKSLNNIKACVIGASSKEHLSNIIETFNQTADNSCYYKQENVFAPNNMPELTSQGYST